MNRHPWGLWPVYALAIALMAACGGKTDGGDPERKTSSDGDGGETEATMTPPQLGAGIADLYADYMSKLVERLKSKPPAADALGDVESLRGECIAKMVAFGLQREALDASGRSTVDAAIQSKMNSMSSSPDFTSFNDIQQHYFQDQQLHKLIMDFNIITQYANYELLKKQAPEEAARLGIK